SSAGRWKRLSLSRHEPQAPGRERARGRHQDAAQGEVEACKAQALQCALAQRRLHADGVRGARAAPGLPQVGERRDQHHAARAHAWVRGGGRVHLRSGGDQGGGDHGARQQGAIPAPQHAGAGVSGRLRGLYFLYYGYQGAFLGYFAPYLRGLRFAGSEIGAVTMASQLVAALAALAWGHAADRRSARPAALRICALGALAATAALPLVRTPLAVGAALLATSTSTSPSTSASTSASPSTSDRSTLLEALALLRDPAVLLLFALCAIHWGACAPYHLLFGVLVRDHGLPSSVTGAGLALG